MALPIQKIIVPIDFSEASERAARYARGIARPLGATLYLIHVLKTPIVTRESIECSGTETPTLRERQYQDARARLATVAAKLEPGKHHITTEVRSGETADGITTAAVVYGADLVIMATHGRTGLSHLLHGSVAERVIRSGRCPVLAIRESGQVHVFPRAAESTKVA